jgi:TrpR-related protein YerC/YecD
MAELRTAEVDDLLSVLGSLSDADQIFALLEDLMTIREIKETSQRLAVARMLDQGKPYTAIERQTGASATTIARVSKALNYGAGGYRAALSVLDARDADADAASPDAPADPPVDESDAPADVQADASGDSTN